MKSFETYIVCLCCLVLCKLYMDNLVVSGHAATLNNTDIREGLGKINWFVLN